MMVMQKKSISVARIAGGPRMICRTFLVAVVLAATTAAQASGGNGTGRKSPPASATALQAEAGKLRFDGACRNSQINRDLNEVTIEQLQGYYARHRYTAVQVVKWYLNRIDKLNPIFNALLSVHESEALSRAASEDAARRRGEMPGPLWGVPVVIKDNISIAGKITGDGWIGYTHLGAELIASRNATIVDRLESAGAIVIGQGNMPDLARADSNFSSLGGRTGNAYNVGYSPGGSSGGPAVAVTLNLAVFGQGTDTGNSIRNPAANASLVGLVPTKGLVSIAGIHPYDSMRDSTGPLSRTVADAAIVLDVIAGADPGDSGTRESSDFRPARSYASFLKVGALKGRRFGIPNFILEGSPHVHPNPAHWNRGVSPETRALLAQAIRQLEAAGATVVSADDLLPEEFDRIASSIHTSAYYSEGIDRFLGGYAPIGLGSLASFEEKAGVRFPLEKLTGGAAQHRFEDDPRANEAYFEPRHQLVEMYHAAMKKWRLDGFVYPALQVPPNDERKPLPADYPSDGPYSATGWVNWLGVPAIVVPAGFYKNGLPFGIELSGNYWGDGELLGYAYAFEQATHGRRPPP